MSTGFPDWTRAIVLLGWDGSNFIPVLLDADGNLHVLVSGETAAGDLVTVRVDSDGQIIMVPRGASGAYMLVDQQGYLSTILKGLYGAELKTLAVDGSGNLIALVKGSDGTALRTLKTDTDGQMIMVPRGQSGNYMSVDASGFLTTILKGLDGFTLRTLAVDGSGNLIALVKGSDGTTLRTLKTDTAGQMIMVPRGQSGNYMAVDASGFLTAVLKGAYGAEYKTLAVDADGKINAFIYDTVDAWGQINSVGLAEMVARLGSPVVYERSGQVYFIDSFEEGLQNWTPVAVGGSSAAAIAVNTKCTGGYSLKITAGGAVGAWQRMIANRGLLPVGKVGFAVAFALPGYVDYLTFRLRYYSSTGYHYGEICLNDATSKVQLWQSGVGLVDVADLGMAYRDATNWYYVKFTVDVSSGKYVRLRLNSVTVDISAYTMGWWASAAGPHVQIETQIGNRTGYVDSAYLDDILLTFAEP